MRAPVVIRASLTLALLLFGCAPLAFTLLLVRAIALARDPL
jgi:hypothetical protein